GARHRRPARRRAPRLHPRGAEELSRPRAAPRAPRPPRHHRARAPRPARAGRGAVAGAGAASSGPRARRARVVGEDPVKALVTGASGLIGGAVAHVLLARGAKVRALVRRGAQPNLSDRSDVETVPGDLRDPRSVRAAAEGCDAIFHVGGLYSFEAGADE